MRTITIPAIDWGGIAGMAAVIPVKVAWPELQLTEDQIVANAVALANDREPPYPDHSIFEVVIERPLYE